MMYQFRLVFVQVNYYPSGTLQPFFWQFPPVLPILNESLDAEILKKTGQSMNGQPRFSMVLIRAVAMISPNP